MARHLAALFFEAAQAPLAEADRQLAAQTLAAALAELTRERLIGAVRQGVESAAKAAGISALQVFQRLPMSELEERVDQLEANQFLVLEALRTADAAAVASAMAAGLSQETSPAPASECFRHLAGSVGLKNDAHLPAALRELADDIESWRQALERCRTVLDQAQDLERRYRKRRLTRVALLALVPLALCAAGAWFGHRHLIRARIDAQLAEGDCAAEGIDPQDRARASDHQHQAIEAAIRACQQQREQERRRQQARRAAEQQRKAAEKKRQERLQACRQYEERFRADELTEADDERAGRLAPIVRRLAQGKLKHADVEADFGPLPCEGSSAAETIGKVYARLVARQAPAWLATRTPSKSVRQLVVRHRGAVDAEALKHLSGHIDVAAKQAVRSGQEADIERFAILCRWKQALALKHFGNCIAVLQLAEGKR